MQYCGPPWPTEEDTSQQTPCRTDGLTMRILLMDDDPGIRKIVTYLLETSGYRIRTVVNGESAVSAFREAHERGDRYGCVILDLLVRNGMGGTETIGMLKEIDPRINAILISGNIAHPAFLDFQASGFDTALKKPFSGDQLLHAAQQFDRRRPILRPWAAHSGAPDTERQ